MPPKPVLGSKPPSSIRAHAPCGSEDLDPAAVCPEATAQALGPQTPPNGSFLLRLRPRPRPSFPLPLPLPALQKSWSKMAAGAVSRLCRLLGQSRPPRGRPMSSGSHGEEGSGAAAGSGGADVSPGLAGQAAVTLARGLGGQGGRDGRAWGLSGLLLRSSHVEGPHLLRGAARGGSEHAERLPEGAARRAREARVRPLPASPHQVQGTPCRTRRPRPHISSGFADGKQTFKSRVCFLQGHSKERPSVFFFTVCLLTLVRELQKVAKRQKQRARFSVFYPNRI